MAFPASCPGVAWGKRCVPITRGRPDHPVGTTAFEVRAPLWGCCHTASYVTGEFMLWQVLIMCRSHGCVHWLRQVCLNLSDVFGM